VREEKGLVWRFFSFLSVLRDRSREAGEIWRDTLAPPPTAWPPIPPAAAGLKPESCPAALPEPDKCMVFIYYYVIIIFLYCNEVPGKHGTLAKTRKEKIIVYL